MSKLAWLVVFGAVGGIVWYFARIRRQLAERQDEAEARMVSLIAEVRPATAPLLPGNPVAAQPLHAPQERLLLDAAGKAGEAGEPVLAIQLYAKLLSRCPKTVFASQARTAVEEQKKKLKS